MGNASIFHVLIGVTLVMTGGVLGSLLLAYGSSLKSAFWLLLGLMAFAFSGAYWTFVQAAKHKRQWQMAAEGKFVGLEVSRDGFRCFIGILENNNMLSANDEEIYFRCRWAEVESLHFMAPRIGSGRTWGQTAMLCVKRLSGVPVFIPLVYFDRRQEVVDAFRTVWRGSTKTDDRFDPSGGGEQGVF